MRVLAIDTALEACSAAVLDTRPRGDHRERNADHDARACRGGDAADRARDGSGRGRIRRARPHRRHHRPGSFTGLRVGISAARGIALAAGKPAIGLSTLAGFAAPHIAEDDVTAVVAAIDARHDHVYLQVFGAGGRTLVAPRIAPLREAVRAAMTGPARIVGSAAPC